VPGGGYKHINSINTISWRIPVRIFLHSCVLKQHTVVLCIKYNVYNYDITGTRYRDGRAILAGEPRYRGGRARFYSAGHRWEYNFHHESSYSCVYIIISVEVYDDIIRGERKKNNGTKRVQHSISCWCTVGKIGNF